HHYCGVWPLCHLSLTTYHPFAAHIRKFFSPCLTCCYGLQLFCSSFPTPRTDFRICWVLPQYPTHGLGLWPPTPTNASLCAQCWS
ncbi:unnamed protein product, partial [Callosobruchus maculatus]